MSSSTCSDVVPFVAHYVLETSNLHRDKGKLGDKVALLDHEAWQAGEFLDKDDETEMPEVVELKGWIVDREFTEIGKRSRLYADVWRKDRKVVYTVNESPYASGGDYALAVISDVREDLESFLADLGLQGLNGVIEEQDTVNQTL